MPVPAPAPAPITGKRFFGVVVLDSNEVDSMVVLDADADVDTGAAVAIFCASVKNVSHWESLCADVKYLSPGSRRDVAALVNGATGKRLRVSVCTGVVCVGVLPLFSA